jgi:hypothetical protein
MWLVKPSRSKSMMKGPHFHGTNNTLNRLPGRWRDICLVRNRSLIGPLQTFEVHVLRYICGAPWIGSGHPFDG